METQVLNSSQIEEAAALLKKGELVAFPTETVYGLAARIFDPDAIQKIFKVKGRPSDNPLIVHVSSLSQVEEIAEQIPTLFYRLANHFFPGPLTVILKRKPKVPSLVSAGLDSIAIRMPSHPIALKLIELVGEPLVAPSANLSGKPSATQAKHVIDDFCGKIAAVIDGGRTEVGIESTVISLSEESFRILRPGTITQAQIEEVLGFLAEDSPFEGPISSPGMKYRHYAPIAPIKLFNTLEDLEIYLSAKAVFAPTMLLCPTLYTPSFSGVDPFILCAQELYTLLRLADEKRYHEILVLCNEAVKKDAGLMNRLTKAAMS